jgi:hypothetical protein
MQDNQLFIPEKMSLVDMNIVRWHLDTPETFLPGKISGHDMDNSFHLSFNLEEKLAKADFTIRVTTNSQGENTQEATGHFHLGFIYHVENLEALAVADDKNRFILNPALSIALASVTYSTARGVLMTRLQGTVLQNFMLPIINPDKLLNLAKP